jgi:hypothetical protein
MTFRGLYDLLKVREIPMREVEMGPAIIANALPNAWKENFSANFRALYGANLVT